MKRSILYTFLLVGLLACKTKQIATNDKRVNHFYQDIAYLASDALEGRKTGTPGERMAAAYIADRFSKMGLSPKGTDGYYQVFSRRKSSDPHAGPKPTDPLVEGRNVVAFLDKGAPTTIVVGAHYDHLGWGDPMSSLSTERGIHNGADDNASGVAIMLDLADQWRGMKLTDNVLFIAFSGEEEGLWGSNYFTKHPTIPLSSIDYMINMDMVGRLNEDRQLAIYGTGTSPQWMPTITSIVDPAFKFKFTESGIGPSDHTSFYLKDIPVLHFFTGQHGDYHRPSDDIEHINFDGMRDVAELIHRIVTTLDDHGRLTFTKTKDEQSAAPRFKVTLGVIPDYLYDGKGMRIDGIREGRPAHKADIQSGDIVMQMGDHDIVDMMSYMKALSAFEGGQTVKVTIRRGDDMIEKQVTFD